MTPEEFKKIRTALGHSQGSMGIALGDGESHYSVRAVASWEGGERRVPPSVGRLARLMLKAHEKQFKKI